MAQEPRAGEDPRVGLLHEILGVVAVAAERQGSAVQPVDVIAEPLGVERALTLVGHASDRSRDGALRRGVLTEP